MEIIASLGSLAIGVVILWVIVKLLSLPFKLVWNGIIGAIMLWLANLLGGALFNVTIHITVIKALIADGADINLKSDAGMTAYEYAVKNESPISKMDVVQELEP